MERVELAKNEMIRWLSHPSELGKQPAKIICTNEFEYLEMTYYIFKFKKSVFSLNWMLGVCGGYEKNSSVHCGHLFSEFLRYNKKREKEDAIKIIEMIRNYWMKEAKKIETKTRNNFNIHKKLRERKLLWYR